VGEDHQRSGVGNRGKGVGQDGLTRVVHPVRVLDDDDRRRGLRSQRVTQQLGQPSTTGITRHHGAGRGGEKLLEHGGIVEVGDGEDGSQEAGDDVERDVAGVGLAIRRADPR
jgi:hypothetical protein